MSGPGAIPAGGLLRRLARLPAAQVLVWGMLAWGLTVSSSVRAGESSADTGAVVFAYGRFGEDSNPNLSIRIDQFEAQIAELTDGDYTVMPLPDIVDTLRRGAPLPDRTVALTIDDATLSVYRDAFPRLRAAELPFTLFVAADPIDRGADTHMTWDQVRGLQRAGVTIGMHTAGGLPMPGRSLVENAADLIRGAERLRAELGTAPALFAYPYGAFSLPIRDLIERQGFTAAFGQSSAVVHGRSDRFALSRFVMNEAYGSIERFRLAAGALPLPVIDLTPADPVLTENPPSLGFTVADGVGNLDRLACFVTGQGRTGVERLGSGRIEIRIADEFPPGRVRINCTLPAADGRWRWFGMQFFVPE
jgi:peptidoglycan/xylan/chitin deacetylase (PgdA/CDA1 family)